ncbi:MAG: hypothetical protein IJR83_03550 [Clostridia bacterium]|nr:hypothetical protein [Clostridia bacterium]
MNTQKSDFKWYKRNLRKLYEQYGDCYLAIKKKTVLGAYSSFAEGVHETEKREKLGTFIVQKCGPDESAYTETMLTLSINKNTMEERAFTRQHNGIVKCLSACVTIGQTPRLSPETLEAMAEAKRISSDPSVKGYKNMDELKTALNS